MTEELNYCEYCGAKLARGANFCEVCGRPVRGGQTAQPPVQRPYAPQPPAQAYSQPPRAPQAAFTTSPPPPPPPSYAAPVQPPRGRSNIWLIAGACGCLAVLCLVVVAAGVIFYLRSGPPESGISTLLTPEPVQLPTNTDFPLLEQPTQITEPAAVPQPASESEAPPSPEPPQNSEQPDPQEGGGLTWSADVGQELNDTYFSDDFSTRKFDWADVVEQYDALGYEDGHYAISLQQENFTVWAYLPVDFLPHSISFDAAIVPEYEQGAYGALCYYQDEQNYHFVSISPWNREYSIGYVLNDEYYTLMNEMWTPSNFLNESPHAVNSIQIDCDRDMITLFINNELEAQVSATPEVNGEMAIFGETLEEISPNGFKVLFDNLVAFAPAQ